MLKGLAFEAYAMLNCCAALLAQMLFVDNCVKEGIGAVSHPANQDTVTRLMDQRGHLNRNLRF